MRVLGFCVFMMMCHLSLADGLGKTYPIKEPDMIDEIHGKLKSLEKNGRLKLMQEEALNRSKNSAEHPRPVAGLSRAVEAKTYYFDPTVRVPRDIFTDDGQLIAKANDKVNPLDYTVMSKHLVFFDESDSEQVKLAEALIKKYDGRVKPILVAGEPFKLTKAWKKQVYFDQGGYLIRRFGIKHVPALVSQQDKKLRIDEMVVEQ